MRSLRRRLRGSCASCLKQPFLYDKPLARLGDAVVNFLVSAALTVYEGRAEGVKVSDRVLDAVYSSSPLGGLGVLPRGFRGADVVEAFYGCLWLCGVLDVEREVWGVAGCLGEGLGLEECLAESVRRLVGRIGGGRK